MSKYAPLGEFLAGQSKDRIPMTFSQIEEVIRVPLPASKQYPAWWSNNPSNNPMTREWLDAGFETESVNIAGQKLVFRRVEKAEVSQPGYGEEAQVELKDRTANPKHLGFGFMKGLLTIEQGYDLTTPSSELWFEGVVTKAGKND